MDGTNLTCRVQQVRYWLQEWMAAGAFKQPWTPGLQDYNELKQIEWAYQAMADAMTKALLGGGKRKPDPT